jgi:hypothetical protein
VVPSGVPSSVPSLLTAAPTTSNDGNTPEGIGGSASIRLSRSRVAVLKTSGLVYFVMLFL